jgi:WD40 repeat protein
VGWRTQDADAARLRDELRHAAKQWNEHGRTDDRLWTGAAYKDYVAWQERYPGGLTDIENAFAAAMTAVAGRRQRRRRIAVASILVIAAVVVTLTTTLWRRSVLQQLRADAANLLSQAQVELESYPSAAVAFATASLELSDTEEARLLALEALWKGPTALVVNEDRTFWSRFTPDGQWLVQARDMDPRLRVIGADGSDRLLDQIDADDTSRFSGPVMGRDSAVFLSRGFGGQRITVGLWSAPEWRPLAKQSYPPDAPVWPLAVIAKQRRALVSVTEEDEVHIEVLRFDGSHEQIGSVSLKSETKDSGSIQLRGDASTPGRIWATRGHDVFAIDVSEHDLSLFRRVFRQDTPIEGLSVDPLGRFVATRDEEGVIRLWDVNGASPPLLIRVPSGERLQGGFFTQDGSLLATVTTSESERQVVWLWRLDGDEPELLRRLDVGEEELSAIRVDPVGLRVLRAVERPRTHVWSLRSPAGAEPIALRRSAIEFSFFPQFSPDGRWLATADSSGLTLWPLVRQYPAVIPGQGGGFGDVAFGPDGRWLASSSWDGTVRLWPLEGDVPPPGRVLFESPPGEDDYLRGVRVTPDGERILVGAENSGAWLITVASGEFSQSPGFDGGAWGVAFSPDGSLAAHVGGPWGNDKGMVRIWEVATQSEVAVLEPRENPTMGCVHFISQQEILTTNEGVLRRWDLDTGDNELVYDGFLMGFRTSADGRKVGMTELPEADAVAGRALILDLETGGVTHLESHGDQVGLLALDSTGAVVVTGDMDGVIRVGPAAKVEPHLLLRHEGPVYALAVDPQGRWIASQGQDKTVRLWPMPDLSKPPLHTLPREELIAKLKTLTNLRVVRDPDSATGWKLTHDPFPGWETAPTW